jgi:uncharacterized protein (DUF2132 family)
MDKKYKYNSIYAFFKDYPAEYHYLYKRNLVEKLCQDMGWKSFKKSIKRKTVTKEDCIEDGLKYRTNTDWDKNSPLYRIALKNGWLEECTAHMRKFYKSSYWTKDLCMGEALKWNSQKEWGENCSSSLIAARKNGWLEECIAHMTKSSYWTKDLCMEEALKHEKKYEWFKASQASYKNAKKHGWFEECTAHMYGQWLRKMIRKK